MTGGSGSSPGGGGSYVDSGGGGGATGNLGGGGASGRRPSGNLGGGGGGGRISPVPDAVFRAPGGGMGTGAGTGGGGVGSGGGTGTDGSVAGGATGAGGTSAAGGTEGATAVLAAAGFFFFLSRFLETGSAGARDDSEAKTTIIETKQGLHSRQCRLGVTLSV